MKDKTTRTKTVQAQYYSHMDFDHEEVGWTCVGVTKNHKTKRAARKAIKAHCKEYHTDTKQRKFRIVTVVTNTRIEDVK